MSLIVIYTHAATMELNEVPQKTKVEVPYNPLYLYDLDTQRTLSKQPQNYSCLYLLRLYSQ